MRLLIHVALLLTMASPITGAYKGGTSPKLAEELTERLKGCQDRALWMYENACAARKQFEMDNQSIVDENREALFGQGSSDADEYGQTSEKINALMAQKLLQRYEQGLETCRAKNNQQALKNT